MAPQSRRDETPAADGWVQENTQFRSPRPEESAAPKNSAMPRIAGRTGADLGHFPAFDHRAANCRPPAACEVGFLGPIFLA
jgi:hypothetical protein